MLQSFQKIKRFTFVVVYSSFHFFNLQLFTSCCSSMTATSTNVNTWPDVNCYIKAIDFVEWVPQPQPLSSTIQQTQKEHTADNKNGCTEKWKFEWAVNTLKITNILSHAPVSYSITTKKQMQEEQANISDLCESDSVDATCFSQFSKMLPYVPTVSNVINKSLEVHIFLTELTEEGNSANMMTDNRLVGQK